jgi:hypothetical protein
MLKRARILIGAVVLPLGVAQQAWAEVQIVPPGSDVGASPNSFGPRHGAVGSWRPHPQQSAHRHDRPGRRREQWCPVL